MKKYPPIQAGWLNERPFACGNPGCNESFRTENERDRHRIICPYRPRSNDRIFI
jgi:hypothetical protein